MKVKINLKKNLPLFLLILIIVIGGFFRLYHIREYMTFLGDEGRDALVVKRIIIDKKLTLLGPITSVGSMYMGPIYYYFMVPFLLIWGFDPVGPAIMVAIFSLLTIILIYKFGEEFFDPIAGLVAGYLYAISPLTVTYGRSSWNPNLVPFFSLLIIYSLAKVILSKKFNWLIITGFSLGILLQLHYVTLMFIPIIILSLLYFKVHLTIYQLIKGLIAFIFTYSPFLLFELRHQFVNSYAVLRFIQTQKSSNTFGLINFGNTIADILVRLFWRLVVIVNAEVTKLFILVLIIALYLYWKEQKKKKNRLMALKLILIWIGIGLLSFGIYQGVIYDYYMGGLFAAPIILSGIMMAFFWYRSKLGKIITLMVLFSLFFFSWQKSHLRMIPNNMVKNTEDISRSVYNKIQAQPYNFALIANKNSDHAYRYFLELWGNPPVIIENPTNDPERKTVTDQLLIVCEEKVCQPLGHPLWEIAGFGPAEIVDEWSVSTVRVFRLKHYLGNVN